MHHGHFPVPTGLWPRGVLCSAPFEVLGRLAPMRPSDLPPATPLPKASPGKLVSPFPSQSCGAPHTISPVPFALPFFLGLLNIYSWYPNHLLRPGSSSSPPVPLSPSSELQRGYFLLHPLIMNGTLSAFSFYTQLLVNQRAPYTYSLMDGLAYLMKCWKLQQDRYGLDL